MSVMYIRTCSVCHFTSKRNVVKNYNSRGFEALSNSHTRAHTHTHTCTPRLASKATMSASTRAVYNELKEKVAAVEELQQECAEAEAAAAQRAGNAALQVGVGVDVSV